MRERWTWEEYAAKNTPSVFTKCWRKSLNRMARLTIISQLRILCYRLRRMHIEKSLFIRPDCYSVETYPELIHVEDSVVVAPRVIATVHGDTRASSVVSRVSIGKDTYVGTGAIVLPCVRIGERVGVGAGTVVTKDVPTGVVVGGVRSGNLALHTTIGFLS